MHDGGSLSFLREESGFEGEPLPTQERGEDLTRVTLELPVSDGKIPTS